LRPNHGLFNINNPKIIFSSLIMDEEQKAILAAIYAYNYYKKSIRMVEDSAAALAKALKY